MFFFYIEILSEKLHNENNSSGELDRAIEQRRR